MFHSFRLRVFAFTGNKVVVILAIVALEKHHFAVIFVRQNMCGDTIEEPTIVGYN
jgi:hypothetical protein